MGGPGLTPADGELLTHVAAETIRARLFGEAVDMRAPRAVALRRLGSSFVTLECAGSLRGCIGSLDPVRPLYRDVIRNASRAMADPRMEPVQPVEWPELAVSVSVLGPPEPMLVRRLDDLRRLLRPHVDGVVVSSGRRQATFLPAVWETLPDPADFLAALLVKGGWSPDRLPPGALVHRYTTHEFHS